MDACVSASAAHSLDASGLAFRLWQKFNQRAFQFGLNRSPILLDLEPLKIGPVIFENGK